MAQSRGARKYSAKGPTCSIAPYTRGSPRHPRETRSSFTPWFHPADQEADFRPSDWSPAQTWGSDKITPTDHDNVHPVQTSRFRVPETSSNTKAARSHSHLLAPELRSSRSQPTSQTLKPVPMATPIPGEDRNSPKSDPPHQTDDRAREKTQRRPTTSGTTRATGPAMKRGGRSLDAARARRLPGPGPRRIDAVLADSTTQFEFPLIRNAMSHNEVSAPRRSDAGHFAAAAVQAAEPMRPGPPPAPRQRSGSA